MAFFSEMTVYKIVGLAALLAGALITFLSGRISAKMRTKHAALIVKLIGLGIVFAGFLLILFV